MLGWSMENTSISQNLVGYSLVYGGTMKKGDLVVRVSEELDDAPMIYMGIGLWTGWIRVYCPKDHKVIQVRKTYVQKVEI